MEDLLKEEEFLPKINGYNPWKRFALFYFIFTLYYAGFAMIFKDVDRNSELVIVFFILFLISLLLTPFALIFQDRKNILLPVKTIVLSIQLLITILYCSVIVREIFDRYYLLIIDPHPFSYYLQFYIGYTLYGLFCSGIIIGIRTIKKRKIKLQQQNP